MINNLRHYSLSEVAKQLSIKSLQGKPNYDHRVREAVPMIYLIGSQEELQNYILEGGFPRAVLLDFMGAKRRYVQSVVDEIYEKDIRRRLKIRNKNTIETVQKYIINNFGATTSLKSRYYSAGRQNVCHPERKRRI